MGLSVWLKKQFKGFDINVAWEIENELAVLFGFSGAGKSVTLQMIAGLMRPDHGCICSGDRKLFDSGSGINVTPQNRCLGYVFQDLALFPHMTVEKNIAYGMNGRAGKKELRKIIAEMIGMFQLTGLENKFPSEISGGQKQRVACARALVRRPDALLLDEPFGSLDQPIRLDMQKTLKDIQKIYNIPILLVTHDIFEAVSIADIMIVYSNGRMHQIGPPREILDHPATSETAALVQAWRTSHEHPLDRPFLDKNF